jgi:arylsulfatase A-like enzyme
MSSTRPNIIFFFSDQQRADTCGCYGQKLNTTPHLDQMAAEGVRFAKAFTAQPVCGPTRAVLQTGLYATETGCFKNNIPLPQDQPTIAKQLSNSGYKVGYIGKWHLASGDEHNFRTEPVPEDWRGGYKDFWLASDVLEFTSHGYDGYMYDSEGQKREFPEGSYRVDAQTDWALEYLEMQKKDEPFFLFTSYIEPHHQNDNNRYEGPHGSKEKWADYEVPGDLVDTKGDWRENYPDYLGCINALDIGLGRIREKLKELGMLDNTIIIYTSDHGSHFKTRNGEYKRSCHEASLHVPLIISGPGFEGGQVINELTSLIDLPKTIMKIAGCEDLPGMQGHNLAELAANSSENWPKHRYYQISEAGSGRGIRTDKWKYCVSNPKSQCVSSEYEESHLYDLEQDPHERNNLIADPSTKETRESLKALLFESMQEANEPQPAITSV